jgi:hypothetical protein
MDLRPIGFVCGFGYVVSLLTASASAPAAEPLAGGAKVDSLVGPSAEIVLGLKPAKPALILGSGDWPVALLLAAQPDQLEGIRKNALVEADPPYCDPTRPVGCCDPARHTMVLRTDLGWLDYGETCIIPADKPEDADVSGDVPEQELDGTVDAELEQRYPGFFERLVLPQSNGDRRTLVRKPSGSTGSLSPHGPSSDLFTPVGLSDEPIVVAQSGSCVATISSCNSNGPDSRCRHSDHFWYTRSGALWCRTPVPCTHRYPPS